MATVNLIPTGVAAAGLVTWSAGDIDKIQSMLEMNEVGDINIEDYWAIGDTRTVSFNNAIYSTSSITWVLTDFNDTSSGGTTYNVVIHSLSHMVEPKYMNSSNTNVGGWNSSYMRNTVMAAIYSAIPSTFKAIIKSGNHVSGAGNASDTIQTTTDNLFLFSEREVQGVKTYSGAAEYNVCKQFEYFETSVNRIKTGNNGSYPGIWWLRSPSVSLTTGFCFVSTDGSANNSTASSLIGVVAAALI